MAMVCSSAIFDHESPSIMTKKQMRYLISATALILVTALISVAQPTTRWILLPETEAEHAKQLCSRPGPPKFQTTWKPTEGHIQTMESRLSRISRLRTQSGIVGVQIKHPNRYYRQYLGIMINGKEFIFINAFCNDKPPERWRESLIDVCDGGCSWGVVYSVATGQFSHLEMNGVA